MIIGILHPGEMGAAVGRVLVGAEHDVVWASEGRSDATRARARDAGLRDLGSVAAVARDADVVFSICPPDAAADVARTAASANGIYVDANAISPETTRTVARHVDRFVDGGIIGSPPRMHGTTRLYLSGDDAAAVAPLFAGTAVDARVLSPRIGDASALKMVYAAWTKGTAALLLAIREVARSAGVEAALAAEWDESLAGLHEQLKRAQQSATAKGWRWVREMEEIAATFGAAGAPDGFHRAAADVFRAYK